MALKLWSFWKRDDSEEEDEELSERTRVRIQNEGDILTILDGSLDSVQRCIKDLVAEAKMLRDFASHLPKNNLAYMELIRAADSVEKTAKKLARIKISTLSVRGFLKGQFK